jgi:hypothetical protein
MRSIGSLDLLRLGATKFQGDIKQDKNISGDAGHHNISWCVVVEKGCMKEMIDNQLFRAC